MRLRYEGRADPGYHPSLLAIRLLYCVCIESANDDYRFTEEAVITFGQSFGWVGARGISTLSYSAARDHLVAALEGKRLILNPYAGLARKYETRVIRCPASLV